MNSTLRHKSGLKRAPINMISTALFVVLIFLITQASAAPGDLQNVSIITSPENPKVGEVVIIDLVNSTGIDLSQFSVQVASPSSIFNYRNNGTAIEFPLSFTPLDPGFHITSIIDRITRTVILNSTFNVSLADESLVSLDNESNETEINESSDNEINANNDTESNNSNNNNSTPNTQTGKPVQIKDSKKKEISGRVKIYRQNNIVFDSIDSGIVTLNHDEYDIEIEPELEKIKKIKLKKVNFKGDIILKVEKIQKKNKIKARKPVDTFAIDPSEIDFETGTITKVATGNKLWKCKDWNFTTQTCFGEWSFLMNIIPGREYDIFINSTDPGFSETGLASINTNKSTYHPNEIARILIVVLDNSGFPVSGANVILNVETPNNITHQYSTGAGTITSTQRGIYEADFTYTSLQGNYSMTVTATGDNVNNTMISSFLVKEFYDFDIIRNTPIVINPWKGPFTSIIKLISFNHTGNFTFTEILPENFTLQNAPGASVIDNNGSIYLTWNVENNSVVSYTANSPLVSPDLYELGPATVMYGNNTYTEARPWFLAIDPAPSVDPIIYREFPSPTGRDDPVYFGAVVYNPNLNESINVTRVDINASDGALTLFTTVSGGTGDPVDPTLVNSNIIRFSNPSGWIIQNRSAMQFRAEVDLNKGDDQNVNVRAEILVEGAFSYASSVKSLHWDGGDVGVAQVGYVTSSYPNYNFSTTAITKDTYTVRVSERSDKKTINSGCNLNVSIPAGWSAAQAASTQSGFSTVSVVGNSTGGWTVRGVADSIGKNGNIDLVFNVTSANPANKTGYVFNTIFKGCTEQNGNNIDSLAEAVVVVGAGEIIIPNISLMSPPNNTNDNDGEVVFAYNVTHPLAIATCELIIDSSTIQTDSSITNNTEQNFTHVLNNGSYTWRIDCTDDFLSGGSSETRTININVSHDTVPPNITLISPADNFISLSGFVKFEYNISDTTGIQNCSLTINGSIDQTSTNVPRNTTQTFVKAFTNNGLYDWNITCFDAAQNNATTETRTVNATILIKNYVMISDVLGKHSLWLETVVINPSNDALNVTKVTFDVATPAMTWSSIDAGDDPNGGGTGNWIISNEDLIWSGTTVTIAPYSAARWKVRARGNRGGGPAPATTIETIITSSVGTFSNTKPGHAGDDAVVGILYNYVDDTTTGPDYPTGDHMMLKNSTDDLVLPNVNHDFMLHISVNKKNMLTGSNLKIIIPSSFSSVNTSTTQTDWTSISVTGGGGSEWIINATLNIALDAGLDASFQYNATPPLSVNNESYLLNSTFSFTGQKGTLGTAITEAVLIVLEDEFSIISDIGTNATVIGGFNVVAGSTSIKLNASVTDDFGVDTVFFTINGTNQTPSQSGNEYFFTQVCSVTSQHNWTAVYANDTQNQLTSNTTLNITWYCDADGPNVPNMNITGFSAEEFLFGVNVTINCNDNGDVGQAGVNTSNHQYQENTTGSFQDIPGCNPKGNSCIWTLPSDILNIAARCRVYDNLNQSSNWNTTDYAGIDNTAPVITSESINDTSVELGVEVLCMNVTVSDAFNNVSNVRATIAQPGAAGDVEEYMLDTGAGCDQVAGDGVYSIIFSPEFGGLHNWTIAFANDTLNNINQTFPGLTFNVVTAGNITVNMTQPLGNILINESGAGNTYTQDCLGFCQSEGPDCRNVTMLPQYKPAGLWLDITNVTTQLTANVSTVSCGDIVANATCNGLFSINSNEGSGNNIWPIRCKGTSNNAAAGVSNETSLTINDRPNINFTIPTEGTWINNNFTLQCNASDSDGVINRTTFLESTNNATFSEISNCVNVTGNSTTCVYNTSNSVCAEDVLCYLRCTAYDDLNTNRSAFTNVRIDNTGPNSTMNAPLTGAYINITTYTVNVTLNDSNGIGEDAAIFEYRQNASASWTHVCNATGSGDPYTVACTWNLAGLTETATYQVRARGNDTLNNIGPYDTETGIIVNFLPSIVLANPSNNSFIQSGVVLNFTITDDSLYDTWWTRNGGSFNFTWLNSLDDIDTTGWAEGEQNITVYANDSIGGNSETNSADFKFTIDNTKPFINVTNPVNATLYNSTTIPVNVSSNETLHTLWYTVDGGSRNVLCTNCSGINTTQSFEVGERTMIIYANDSANNIANETIQFTIQESPSLLIMISDVAGKESLWLETIVLNPTISSVNITDVTFDLSDTAMVWQSLDDGDDPDGGGSSLWSINNEDLEWSGSVIIGSHSSGRWKVRADGNKGGNPTAGTITARAFGNLTTLTKQEDIFSGDDSVVGIFYNFVDDITTGPNYAGGDHVLLRNSTNEMISPGYNHNFTLHISEIRGKATFSGGDLTITVPKEFTNVGAATSQTDWSSISVSGGGSSDWSITANLDIQLNNDDTTFNFNATPAPKTFNKTWELDTRFAYIGNKGSAGESITEAGLEIFKDDPPVVATNYAINVSGIQDNETNVRLNVTVTDDFGVDTVLFEYKGINESATQDVNEWYITDICNVSGVYLWTGIYANDTINQNDSQDLNLNWTCDINNPNTPNLTVDNFSPEEWFYGTNITINCNENGDVGPAGINTTSYHYQENTTGSFQNITGCSATTNQCNWTLPADVQNIALRCRVFDNEVHHASIFNTTDYAGIDNTAPTVTLNLPVDSFNTSSTSVNFNWTVTDNFDTNISCNLSINGTVTVSNIPSLNNTATNQTVTGISTGVKVWNVTCIDDATRVNNSITRSFVIYS